MTGMKLKELADENQLLPEHLLEDIPDALGIELPDGLETDLDQQAVNRILACAGWERVDGSEHEAIVPKEYEERHKRSQAAKKAAQTRKRKEEQAEAKKKADQAKKDEEERLKHEAALAEREREEQEALEAAALVEEAAAAEAEAEESKAAAAEAAASEAANEAQASAPEPEAPATEAEAEPSDASPAIIEAQAEQKEEDVHDIITRNLKKKDKPAAKKEKAEPAAPTVLEEEAEQKGKDITQRQERAAKIAAAAKALANDRLNPEENADGGSETAEDADSPALEEKPKKAGLGSKLAGLAKATAEKSDHRLKEADPKSLQEQKIARDPDAVLSNEEKRRAIQDNIKRNLDLAKRVKGAKDRDRKRKGGFRSIDNRGKAGPGGGPGGGRSSSPGQSPMPGAPGAPGAGGGPRRGPGGRRGHQGPKKDEIEGRQRGGRRKLTTEEEDLSNITEFTVTLPCSVREFSEASGIKTNVVIAKLFMTGIVANVNSTIEKDAIELLADEFKKTVTFKETRDIEDELEEVHLVEDNEEDLAPRPPIVTVLGHVDHGKTSILDAIRKTAVTDGESGGITQHIGAYTVTAPNGMEVTFIDTPGHEAFTEMRARGANITDVAVIVVAADDGIMPQTIEAINHAKAAGVAIIVAMNKIDKEGADKEKVLRQLSEQELIPESWGGDVGVIETSATTGQGIDELLERLALETEVLELSANHFAQASGTVIEAHMSEGRGIAATLLVQRGSLSAGEIVIAGTGYGRVRNMADWKGDTVTLAGPSHAVEIIGLSEIPKAGDNFHVADNLKIAADAAEQRQHKQRELDLRERQSTTTMASIFDDIAASKMKEFKVIVKADTAGSLEVLKKSLKDLSNEEIRINILHAGVGYITTGDVTLAEVSQAIILGFHVIADSKARSQAESKGVDIESYSIIYELIDNVKLAMSGLLDPELLEKVIGHAEVRQTFRSSKIGTIAGLYVTDGRIERDSYMRITRDGVIVHEGKVNTLRRFKEDVKEVKNDYECGLTVEKFNDIQNSDIFEFYIREKKARTLA